MDITEKINIDKGDFEKLDGYSGVRLLFDGYHLVTLDAMVYISDRFLASCSDERRAAIIHAMEILSERRKNTR